MSNTTTLFKIEQNIIKKVDFNINDYIEECKKTFWETQDVLVDYEYNSKNDTNAIIILYVKSGGVFGFRVVLGGLMEVNIRYENAFRVNSINPSYVEVNINEEN